MSGDQLEILLSVYLIEKLRGVTVIEIVKYCTQVNTVQ